MLKGIYGVLIGMLLVMLVMYAGLIMGKNKDTKQQTRVENPRYHLQLIVQSTNENFLTNFREGAEKAGEEDGVYVELVTLKQLNVNALKEAVEMGVNAGVDGIALQAADISQTRQIIEAAKKQGIAIMTYENNNYPVSDTPAVGTNSYNLGYYAANMAVEATGGKADVAVIINNEGNDGEEEYKNNIIQGILDSFDAYSTMEIPEDSIYTVDTDMFEAEEIASHIINKADKPDLIICMDEKCTPGIAQIFVDNNLVGDIKIVGYGVTKQTLDYIDHGVIYGIVCPDANEIGYDTVKQLVQSLDGEPISGTVSTGLYTINRDNVRDFLEKWNMNKRADE